MLLHRAHLGLAGRLRIPADQCLDAGLHRLVGLHADQVAHELKHGFVLLVATTCRQTGTIPAALSNAIASCAAAIGSAAARLPSSIVRRIPRITMADDHHGHQLQQDRHDTPHDDVEHCPRGREQCRQRDGQRDHRATQHGRRRDIALAQQLALVERRDLRIDRHADHQQHDADGELQQQHRQPAAECAGDARGQGFVHEALRGRSEWKRTAVSARQD